MAKRYIICAIGCDYRLWRYDFKASECHALTSHIITHMIFDETNRIFVIFFALSLSLFLRFSLCHFATAFMPFRLCLQFYEIMSSNIFISSFAQLVPMLRINKCLLRDITWFILYLPFLCRFLLTFFVVDVRVFDCDFHPTNAYRIESIRIACGSHIDKLNVPLIFQRNCFALDTMPKYTFDGIVLVHITINWCVFILTNETKNEDS